MVERVKVFVNNNTALSFKNKSYVDFGIDIKIGEKFGCDILIGIFSAQILFLFGKEEQGVIGEQGELGEEKEIPFC